MGSEGFLVVGEAVTDRLPRNGAFIELPGGSPLNVAVGIGRLGLKVLLATRVGADSWGEEICHYALDSGVTLIGETQGLPRTSTATASIADDGSVGYTIDATWDITLDMIPASPYLHVHTGSAGATLEPGGSEVLKILQRHLQSGATISYDPNIRPDIMGDHSDIVEKVETYVGMSHLVKASTHDIEWLYPGRPAEEVAKVWQQAGPSIVVVTKGSAGAFAHGTEGLISVAPKSRTVLDTVGAGDAFMSGLLVALATRNRLGASGRRLRPIPARELKECLEFAQECAGISVSRAGSDPPSRADVEDFYPR